MLTKSIKVLLLLSLLIILAACGGDDDGGDNDTSNGGVDLSETANTQNEELGINFTVNYPDGWAATDSAGSILIANSQDFLEAAQAQDVSDVDDGQIAIVSMPLVGLMQFAMGLEEGATVSEAVTHIQGIFFEPESGESNFSEPEEIELNGKAAAIITGTGTVNGNLAPATMIAVTVEGGYAIFVARYEGDFDEEIQAIAGSAEVETTE